MKKKLLRGIVFLLTVCMMISLLPAVSLAVNNELVLTKIGHNSTDSVIINDSSLRAVTLTVPYLYTGSTVDLKDGGLKIEKASAIGAVVTDFESGSTATVGDPGSPGAAVVMTVTYYKGTDTTTQYNTLYSISIVRTAQKYPSFTGSITKSVTGVMPNAAINDIIFTANDFYDLYKANDGGALTNISISGSSLACGSLKIAGDGSYTNYTAGNMIGIADIGNLVFDAVDGGSVSYFVSAYAGTDTSTAIGSVLLNIDVKDITEPTLKAANTVTKSVAVNANVTFSASDFTSLCSLNNGTFNSIEITPLNTGFGTWSNGSAAFTTATVFTTATIGNLKFTGSAAGSATFAWRISNEAGYSTPGNGTITVNPVSVPTITGSIAKSVALGSTLTFSLSDFSSRYNLNNGTLKNIVITPANSTYGTWYKGSSAFTGATAFNANDIGTLKFIGKKTGQAAFSWTVSNNEKGTSSAGSGSITVTPAASEINYTTALNTPKTFALSDFNTACYNATAGSLSYVTFTSMSPSAGTLYYGYSSPSHLGTAISWNSPYASQYLSSITFVPTSNYTGTVTVAYTGVTTINTAFTGSVKIAVGSTSDVTYSTALNTAKTFVASDFNTVSTNTTAASLRYIYFTSAPSSGSLFYGYSSPSSTGTAVSLNTAYYYNASTPYISYITFVPASNFTGSVTIPYVAYSVSGSTYTGTVRITVGSSGNVTYTTAQNTPRTFTLSDFTTACSYATNGGTLSYVYFTSITPTAALYYGYSSSANPGNPISSSSQVASQYLSGITFVPPSNYNGTVTITYTGITTAGVSYTGSVIITVGGASDVTYSTAVNTPKTFTVSDFNTACGNITNGETLSYLYFSQLSASNGALYYGYSSAASPGTAITSSNQIASSYLSSITFVPAANYTGSFTITYTGVTTSGTSYTGYVKMTVGTSATVTYTTAMNTPKTFALSDFSAACSSATNGGTLSYVNFSSLSAANGALYYGYTSATNPGTAISTSTQIAASYLSGISFVPASNYNGTVTITYTGVTTGGVSYTGSVKITVGSSGNVTYSTNKNTAKTFSAADFNTVCAKTTGTNLSYIILTPASSAYGTLYKNYVSAASPGTAITSSTAFYSNSTPSISSVTFVPASNYTGTVSLSYTGFNTNGVQYQGSVIIGVNGPAGDISYTIKNNQTLKFASTDINTVCYNTTGANLNYVAFSLPSAASGKLYYNYTSASSTGSAVIANAAYYKENSPYISNVTFVPTVNYTGSVTINYAGYNVNGISYTGKIVIQVNKSIGSSHFTDVGQSYDWAAGAIDFLYDAGIAKGTGSTLYNPSANMTRGDFMVMLYRAMSFSGSTSSNFSDVPKGSYYYDAIAAAKALGIAQGNNNKFDPNSPITRQDAMMLLYRALLLTGKTLTAGSSSDVSGFTDKGKISSYALPAVETLVKAGMIKGSNSKINPTGTLSRAEMAVIVYRVKITY